MNKYNLNTPAGRNEYKPFPIVTGIAFCYLTEISCYSTCIFKKSVYLLFFFF